MTCIMKTKYLIIVSIAVFLFTACSEGWLDVNTDPNNPSNVKPELVLPAAEMSLASQFSVNYNIAGGMWAQFWTQNPTSNQYKQYDSYDIQATTLDAEWRELYSGALKELQYVKTYAKENKEWRLYLIAASLQAYVFQYLADLYDKIPYREALRAEENIMNPKFDDAVLVYDSITADLDFALSKDLSKFTTVISSDFLFNGDPDRWTEFANTLKLRIYLRQWKVRQAVAQAGLQKLFNSNAAFLTTDAKIDVFVDEKGKGNPLYESDRRELNTKLNIRASKTLISFLTANNDTDERIEYFFERGTSGEFIGNPQGDFNKAITADEANKISLARILATDPVILISAAESYFLQAEAKYKLGAPMAEVRNLYESGVLAAFSRFGLDGSRHIAPTGKYAFDTNDPLKSIITQKWVALVGINGMEAYIEHLRTGIPKRSNVGVDDTGYVPGEFTHPVQSVLPKGQFPRRLIFPDSERKSNPNTPDEVSRTTPTWWQ